MTKTTDLCDAFDAELQIAQNPFRDYGGKTTFEGRISTIQCYEDNVLIKKTLEQPGAGRVLVVDGGTSFRRALIGDLIVGMAQKNGWTGLVLNGFVRDSAALGQLDIGIKALGTVPLRPLKRGLGATDIPVQFAGVTFTPGHYLYADEDGIVVAAHALELAAPSERL